MLNGNILSVDIPPKIHPSFGHVEIDTYYTEVRHVPKESAYKRGDVVHYWLEQVYELEGQRKLLKENYRVLKEENIITLLKQEVEQPVEGMLLVELYKENLELARGIKLTAPVRKAKLVKARVLRSTCSISEGSDLYVRASKGYKVGDNWLFKEEHVEALF